MRVFVVFGGLVVVLMVAGCLLFAGLVVVLVVWFVGTVFRAVVVVWFGDLVVLCAGLYFVVWFAVCDLLHMIVGLGWHFIGLVWVLIDYLLIVL